MWLHRFSHPGCFDVSMSLLADRFSWYSLCRSAKPWETDPRRALAWNNAWNYKGFLLSELSSHVTRTHQRQIACQKRCTRQKPEIQTPSSFHTCFAISAFHVWSTDPCRAAYAPPLPNPKPRWSHNVACSLFAWISNALITPCFYLSVRKLKDRNVRPLKHKRAQGVLRRLGHYCFGWQLELHRAGVISIPRLHYFPAREDKATAQTINEWGSRRAQPERQATISSRWEWNSFIQYSGPRRCTEQAEMGIPGPGFTFVSTTLGFHREHPSFYIFSRLLRAQGPTSASPCCRASRGGVAPPA